MKRITVLSCAATLGLSLSGAALAAEQVDDISGYTCRQVLLANGAERDLTVVFLQGYFVGTSGKTTFDPETLAAATDRFLDLCIDEPGGKALNTMEQALKAADGGDE